MKGMYMDPALLTDIITRSQPNAGPNSPYGFCYVGSDRLDGLKLLHAGGMIEVGGQNPSDMSFPVRPTEMAIKWNAQASAVPHLQLAAGAAALPQHAEVLQNIEIEDNVPMPERKAFGRTSDGASLVDKYPFNAINVGQSFFVPQDAGADKPKHRTFSSVVSQANRKFMPKYFSIREDKKNGVPGARIFRMEDVAEADRPKRTRKKATAGESLAAQQQQTQWQAPGGFGGQSHMLPAPGVPAGTQPIPGVDFMPQSGFPPAPAGFPGGFPAPGNPAFGQPAAPGGFPPPAGGFGAPPQTGQSTGFPAPAPGWGDAPAGDPNLPAWSS